MRLHKITEAEVESAVEEPEFLAPSTEGKLNAWIETSGKFLRVTYKQKGEAIMVITAAKKRRGWR